MANKDQIKKTILDLAGNPSSGVVAELADQWAEAIERLDSIQPDYSAALRSEKEIRVTKPTELR
jgi:hypothetical protein